jgi:hypothetical protein
LRRQRLRRGAYPVVPLFVDLSPEADPEAIQRAFGRRRGKALCDCNGLVRRSGERIAEFAALAARRYVKDLIREHQGEDLRIAITGGRELTGGYDLALDWRGMLDDGGRLRDSAGLPLLVETLSDIRFAAQSRAGVPQITVEPHLRLPLGVLVGWEWNRVWPSRSDFGHRLDGGWRPSPQDPRPSGASGAFLRRGRTSRRCIVCRQEPRRHDLALRGRHQRPGATHLHLDGSLDAAGICDIANWTIEQLASLNSRAISKHLLLLGPVSLAVRIGASANGTGRTTIPFWDSGTDYGPSVLIG